MNDSVFVAIFFNVMAYFTYKRSTVISINEIKYFPERANKGWITPPSWLCKWFNITKRKIPMYLLIRLYFAITFQILIFISPVLCLIVGDNTDVLVKIGLIFLLIVITETLIWAILTTILKHRK